MKTHATDDELNRLVDASLDLAGAQRIRAHVDTCNDCQREVASIARLLERSMLLNLPEHPRHDLWPLISGAALEVQRRRRRRWALRATAVAATVLLMASAGTAALVLTRAGESMRGVWTRIVGGAQPTPVSPRAAQTAALLTRAAHATGDWAFYERRRVALTDSLTVPERSSIEESAVLAVRLREIDSLTVDAETEPSNTARAQAVGVALDAWYFDVQQLRRDLKLIRRP